MKGILLALAFLLVCVFMLSAQNTAHQAGSETILYPNLPDPQMTEAGEKVLDVLIWENTRRGEILTVFTQEVYGRSPKAGEFRSTSTVLSTTPIANGTAVRKMVQISVSGPNGTHSFEVPVYLPKKEDKEVPVFILINHRNPIYDTSSTSGFFPLDSVILPRGYGAAVINDVDVADDIWKESKYREGIIDKFDLAGPNDWKTIGAWSFAASRILDYLETDPDVNASQIAVIGHSRGGKASLWAGAQDERIALTCVNDSGCTGDALARRAKGETIKVINKNFPHWFADKYNDYNDQDQSLPFDQHQLLTLIAPRLLATASASEDNWADPVGQFHSLVYAQSVFALYQKTTTIWLTADAPDRSGKSVVLRNGNIQHHLRQGKHDLKVEDWNYYLDFADYHFRK